MNKSRKRIVSLHTALPALIIAAIFLVPSAVSAQTGYGGGGGDGGSIGMFIATVAGDVTGDRRVNILDFNALLSVWGRMGGGFMADLNHDGRIDILDFNILMANWER